MSDADAIQVLKFLAKHDLADQMFIMLRDGELAVAEDCSDLWFWASADMEDVTVDNLSIFESAIQDCKAVWNTGEIYAGTIFACRVRKMRPQNACYSSYPKQLWPLLDACGPEREVDFLNPYTRAQAEAKWEEKAPPY